MNKSDYQYLLQGDKKDEWLDAKDIQTYHINKFYKNIGMAHQSKVSGYKDCEPFEGIYKTADGRNITYTYIIRMEFSPTHKKLYYINISTGKKREIIEREKLPSHNGAKANHKGGRKISIR